MTKLRVVLIKPSKYGIDGSVERFRKGYMPNATLWHIASLTPDRIGDTSIMVHTVDEYVWQDLEYLRLLLPDPDAITLVALVGVQSHQFHRALDLAAYARHHGVRHCIIGGPHPMTCDTTALQGRGVSFALAEAELIWRDILEDAISGELRPVYGAERRWAEHLPPLVINPPSQQDLARYGAPILGLYPVRGCPYKCNFCSVIKISGRQVRSPGIESTIESLRRAKHSGIELIMFVSDNFNKYPDVRQLLQAMIDKQLGLKFFCQCDVQIAKDPELIELLGRANCVEMFVGVESFNRNFLKGVNKHHNRPEYYAEIVKQCDEAGIRAHFSSIIGFADENQHDIDMHLDILKSLRPKVASFYILTPIPGTEQYDEFRESGLIVEKNLDHFDATHLTWKHPLHTSNQLEAMLYRCYADYYGYLLKAGGLSDERFRFVVYYRYLAGQRIHPMSGGVDRLKLDGAQDYEVLRKTVYGVEYVPLPNSLCLSAKDENLNRQANWRIRRTIESTAICSQ